MSSYVYWLHAGALSAASAGGKGASLSALSSAGFRVPAGFVLVADAYRYFCSANGLDTEIGVSNDGASAAEIAALITIATLPADLQDEIATAYESLRQAHGSACAVRSSSLSEDGSSASYAGLYDSYLNVIGLDELYLAIKRCYASLWTDRAAQYRLSHGIGSEIMSVVVMAMVFPQTAGVAFTAHPITGARDQVIINSSWGLGEAVVSGLVSPDSFVIAKQSWSILQREISDKELEIVPNEAGIGTIERVLEAERASAPSLGDAQARVIARMAVDVEQLYGSPQDIEFGVVGGDIYLLQARPITTLN